LFISGDLARNEEMAEGNATSAEAAADGKAGVRCLEPEAGTGELICSFRKGAINEVLHRKTEISEAND
jgi:hypothetical protein